MGIVNVLYTVKVTSAGADVTLVPATPDFIMATFVATNTTDTDATIIAKIADGNGTELARLVSATVVAAGESEVLDIRSMNIPKTSFQLMVNSSITGVHFIASGGNRV